MRFKDLKKGHLLERKKKFCYTNTNLQHRVVLILRADWTYDGMFEGDALGTRPDGSSELFKFELDPIEQDRQISSDDWKIVKRAKPANEI